MVEAQGGERRGGAVDGARGARGARRAAAAASPARMATAAARTQRASARAPTTRCERAEILRARCAAAPTRRQRAAAVMSRRGRWPATPRSRRCSSSSSARAGFDFTGYKRTSLERRFRRRMDAVGCTSFGDYLDYLEVHPDEYEQLFETLLINVTEFFRDPPAWEHLRERRCCPALLAGKADDEPIRVWSAGCASGQEAYTVAMVLAELLGVDAYRERVKIYATDIDEDALAAGAAGDLHAPRRSRRVPEELRERYFERADQRSAFRKDLRRTVIFGRNNLVQDAPISRLDLLVCRNTLMYFNAETQARILRHFHFALRDDGVADARQVRDDDLAPRPVRGRSTSRSGSSRKRPRAVAAGARAARSPTAARRDAPTPTTSAGARDAALELGPHAAGRSSRAPGALTFANLPARALFRISRRATSAARSPTSPLAHRPGRAARARSSRRCASAGASRVGEVAFTPERGDARRLDVTVAPLLSRRQRRARRRASRSRTSRATPRCRRELEGNRRDLELAYEELQSTIDELETTNEELQSANEELQTTNEELQSTNEELETMNEELQSTNEELETINDELRDRTGELNRVNEFLEAILTSLGARRRGARPRSSACRSGTARAEDLWGLRARRGGRPPLPAASTSACRPSSSPRRCAPCSAAPASARRASWRRSTGAGAPIVCATTILPLAARGAATARRRAARSC